MKASEQTVAKLGTDVTITDLGEAETLTESTPLFGNVSLVAGKTGVISQRYRTSFSMTPRLRLAM